MHSSLYSVMCLTFLICHVSLSKITNLLSIYYNIMVTHLCKIFVVLVKPPEQVIKLIAQVLIQDILTIVHTRRLQDKTTPYLYVVLVVSASNS